MLFNSYVFIFAFLPVALLGFFLLSRFDKNLGLLWLFGASLFFYGWWNPTFVVLILVSIAVNYGFFSWLTHSGTNCRILAKCVLTAGIIFNLGVLCYYKYTDFIIGNLNDYTGSFFLLQHVILPIGLSFYTFEQIACLVDSYRGEVKRGRFIEYCVFVSFFPRLIAGPIVRYQEIIPQFETNENYRLHYANLSVGLTIFFIGLFKKVVLADSIAIYANIAFEAAGKGVPLTLWEAWLGALAYTFQLYFDFSGYTDMAIGLARMFNIVFPLNFYSPYKAKNIIEFWRSWHMTLSRFLRDYIYIPLGGNRRGKIRRYVNVMVTMLLGGLWHGAGWTFVLWGGLHGIYLVINQVWHNVITGIGFRVSDRYQWLTNLCAQGLTFLAVVAAWVLFRAKTVPEAMAVFNGMMGNHITMPRLLMDKLGGIGEILVTKGVTFTGAFPNLLPLFPGGPRNALLIFVISVLVVWFLPNTNELMSHYKPALDKPAMTRAGAFYMKLQWKPNLLWFVFILLIATFSLSDLDHVREFLYYQF
jgi:alginate O-acetyltransferase complex protein AlgI